MDKKATIIAFYLPQFHPVPENDSWWGKGFTEWTNVGKAKSLFKNHYQPRVPADLGYYDLRVDEVREAQAALARNAGISAFCYWNYWFGNGKRLLEMPMNRVVETGTPDFPFCLGWANHSWENKNWNANDQNKKTKLLIEQQYPGKDDIDAHFYALLPVFSDKRYFKIKNKLAFLIYDIEAIPDFDYFKDRWQKLCAENGLPGFFFMAHTEEKEKLDSKLFQSCDAVNLSLLKNPFCGEDSFKFKLRRRLGRILKRPFNVVRYSNAIEKLDDDIFARDNVFPTIIPNWDHTPRLGLNGTVYHQSTPELFNEHVKRILNLISNKNKEDKIVFLKSWNEWAEGNYIEPDIVHGTSYLDALKDAVS